MITLLDYRKKKNNRIHHTVEALRGYYDEVWLLCRSQPLSGNLFSLIKNILPLPVKYCQEGNLHILEYNPPLNYRDSYEAVSQEKGEFSWFRSLVNLAGFTREIVFIITILYVAVRHVKGTFLLCVVETSWEGIVAMFLRKMGRIGKIVFDDNDFNPALLLNRLRRNYTLFTEKHCIRSADLVISAGTSLAEFWEEETGREVLVIPNGVDTKRFIGSKRDRARSPTRLVYVGNLSTSWIDIDLLLLSVNTMLDGGFDIILTIAGRDETRNVQSLKNQIRRERLTENIELLGEVDHENLPIILQDCDVGIALSPLNLLRKFAFPIKVVEYMAMGIPVIGSKGTEVESIIEKYQSGVCIRPAVIELCNAVIRFIEDEDFFERCSMNALHAAKDFDLEKLATRRYEEIVQRLTPQWNLS